MKRLGWMVCALGALTAGARAGVIVVDASGQGDVTSIAEAVQGAHDGDVILVRPGIYDGFLVQDLSVTIVADPPGGATVKGTTTLRQVAAGRTVVVRGLQFLPIGFAFSDSLPMRIEGCDGSVRVEDCTLVGADGWNGFFGDCGEPNGEMAVLVGQSDDVALIRCTLEGGHGYNAFAPEDCSGSGGAGVQAFGSHPTLFDCIVRGGGGGYASSATFDPAQIGGAGLGLQSSGAWLSGCTVIGGDGGGSEDDAADGAAGVQAIVPPGIVSLLGTVLQGGEGGVGGTSDGDDGAALFGPATFFHETPRHFVAPAAVREGESGTLVADGLAGEAVLLLGGTTGGQFQLAGQLGPFLQPLHFAFILPLGGVPAGGELVMTFTAPPLPVGVDGVVVHLQAWFGGGVLGPSSVLVLLDESF
jgi:hypothetical protein